MLFVGVAGALHSHIALGDVVMATLRWPSKWKVPVWPRPDI
ncbi:hypothetical protein [Streptosporangium amethystogenes]